MSEIEKAGGVVQLTLKSQGRELSFELPVEVHQCQVLKPEDRPQSQTWSSLTEKAIMSPINARSILHEDLSGKNVAIIVDDWGRPTPVYEFIGVVLDAVKKAGAQDENISIITASGMHEPMNRSDLERKLGAEVVAKYRCISHDGGDVDSLEFCGVSELGTPIWINRAVAQADYKIACGRVYPHPAYGYEGGYKMILPGVASFETIVRDHSFNFSPKSIYGVTDGPSRTEADSVGKIIGIDYLINYVVNSRNEPIEAFGGQVEAVHRKAIAFGDEHVWGVALGCRGDVTIAVSDSSGVDQYAVQMAALATKPGGTVIMVVGDETTEPRSSDLHNLSLSELYRLHEKRDFDITGRELQWRIKAVRGEELRRRLYFGSGIRFAFVGGRLSSKTLELTGASWYGSLKEAIDQLVSPECRKVVVLPEPRKTLPLITYHSEKES